jgi:protein phosphatase
MSQLRIAAPADHVCGVTDVGKVRRNNEDTFHVAEDGGVLVVADGLGGLQAGEVASALAVETVVRFFSEGDGRGSDSSRGPEESQLLASVKQAHSELIKASQSREEYRGMATALVLACIKKRRLSTCHVGDVRCYVRDKSGLKQITGDHSVVGAMVRTGQLSVQEARVDPRRNQLVQAVGFPASILPEFHSQVLADGDIVLLCSDGLWDSISDEEICSVLDAESSIRARAVELVQRANDAGGKDNITVILYRQTEGMP